MFWLIGVGGAIGAGARYLLGIWMNKKLTDHFFVPTLIINISGSFLLGMLVQLHNNAGLGENFFPLVGIGFCGAFTTFSTFSVEAVTLFLDKNYTLAFSYIFVSTIVGLAGAFLGYII